MHFELSSENSKRRCRLRLAAIDYVDLRFDERMYVRPPKAVAHVKQ